MPLSVRQKQPTSRYHYRLRLALLCGLFMLCGGLVASAQPTPQESHSRVKYNNGQNIEKNETRILSGPLSVNVNTNEDTVDADTGDGQCSDANGKCSLRAAIMQANVAQSGSVITLPAGTYEISLPRTSENNDPQKSKDSQGDFDILQSMSIVGAGADVTIINGKKLDSVFEIANGAVVNISKLTITNGNRPTSATQTSAGGNIWVSNFSIVTLDQVIVTKGEADYGGGIEVDRGGVLTMTNSAIFKNHARSLSGGLDVYGMTSKATLRNVTVYDNTSDGKSGGIEVMNGAMLQANNVTITVNSASSGVDGINLTAAGEVNGTAMLSNTLIANNDEKDCAGVFVSDGSNLITAPGSCTFDVGDIVNVNAGLLNFGVQDSVIPVHSFDASSPAFNTGRNATCEPTDARGVSRPQGTRCDIGAFEYVIPPVEAVDLLMNGNFEETNEALTFPLEWRPVNLGTGDKLVTNREKADGSIKVFAYSGIRAFQFKGRPEENSRIVQLVDATGVNVGDTLEISAFVWSKRLAGNARVRLIVRYADMPNGKLNLRIPTGSTGDYIPLSDQLTVEAVPEKIKVLVQFKGANASGKFYVDAMTLKHSTGSTEGLVPLPPAP